MCKYCKRVVCTIYIDKWLSSYDYCGICKKHITINDLISLSFLDDLAQFFIKEEKNETKITKKEEKSEIDNINKDICPKHNNKFEYYCNNCNKNLCIICIMILSDESKKHRNYLIIEKQFDSVVRLWNESLQEINDLKKVLNDILFLVLFFFAWL